MFKDLKLASTAIKALKQAKKQKPYRVVYQDKGYIVLEYAPQCRTVKIAGEWYTEAQDSRGDFYDDYKYIDTTYYLSFPYMQFACWGDFDLGVTFSNKPVKRIDSFVHLPFLPNFRSNGTFCLGEIPERLDDAAYGEDEDGNEVCFSDYSRLQKALKLIEAFWLTQFQLDDEDTEGIRALKESKLETFDKWQEKSKKNPKFILKEDLGLQMKIPYSVQHLYQKKMGMDKPKKKRKKK